MRSAPRHVTGLPTLQRTLVMGVLNATPDSFSDGGRLADADEASAYGQILFQTGADVVDVGGESTRPGAGRVSDAEEQRRVLPVVAALAAAGVVVSIDTMRAATAAAALDAGAVAINDVSGGLADPAMLDLAAERDVPVVLSHWRGHSATMQERATYDDVVARVVDALAERVEAAARAGVRPEHVAIDPGLGFGKRPEHNWALLAALPELQSLGRPILLGASRKSFLGELLRAETGPRQVSEREAATTAVSTLAALHGVWGIRTHRVRDTADAVRVAEAWAGAARGRQQASPRSRARVPTMLDVTGRPSAGQAPPMESDEAAHVLPVTGAPWPAEGSGRMDRVAIHGISATGHHGWLPEERVSGQRFVVDVDLGVDVRQAAASDDLSDTVDYAAVSEDVAAILSGPPVRLIERLAEDIATACLQRSGVREVVVRVHKPQAPIAVPFDDVTVTIHRSRP